MEDQIVSSEVAKLAKDKGFKEPTYSYYAPDKDDKLMWLNTEETFPLTNEFDEYNAPTQSLLQKWLRNKYDIHIVIEHDGDMFYYVIQSLNGTFSTYDSSDEDGYGVLNYEEALEMGLLVALKLINL